MGLSNRLRERREQLGLTQGEVASLLGITPSAVGNYENGVSTPKADILFKVFDALKCDANYLFQDEMTSFSTENSATPEEMENLVKKYRTLDNYGKKQVNTILDNEYQRCQVDYVVSLGDGLQILVERQTTSEKNTLERLRTYLDYFKNIHQESNIAPIHNTNVQFVDAAHTRTDIPVTDTDIQHDDNIINKENFSSALDMDSEIQFYRQKNAPVLPTESGKY